MSPSLLLKIFLMISAPIMAHSYSQCVDNQKSLLLQLKNELIFNSSISTKLVHWNQNDDCCNWHGVECDAAGHVISLQLDDEAIYGGIEDSSSLFRLKYLEKLNLANNKLNSTQIPRGIHNLTYLTHLNLSNAAFAGQVPLEIFFLRRLVSLDISNDYWVIKPLKLEFPNLEMLISNMTGLRELYLDYANISSDERRKWSHIISTYLPNLTALSMNYCSLSGPLAMSFWELHFLSILRLDENDLSAVAPGLFANFASLTTLSLVNCRLNGSFPNMVFQIPTLQNLDLIGNHQLSGSIPPFTQTGSLESIRLRNTNFSGLIPSSISNLKTLSQIDLSSCKFTGPIPSTFANLTQLAHVDLSYNSFTGSLSSMLSEGLSTLVYLNLEANSFSGSIPCFLFGLPSLSELHLSNNQFTGQVENFHIVNVSNIVILDLSRNRLEGPIPDSLFQLLSLESVLFYENMFNGTFQLDKIQNFANIIDIDLSDNFLSVDVDNYDTSTYELHQLKVLALASCNMHGFPYFLKHSDVRLLDLSNNLISGEIPIWIWGRNLEYLNLSINLLTHVQKPYHIPTSLNILDLHSNHLRGELHLPVPPVSGHIILSLANNTGSIPTSLCSARYLNILDLSVNKLSGSVLPCLLDTMVLFLLDLRRNNISGHIPDFSVYCDLQYLDLNSNSLEGKIPKSLKNCGALMFMNVRNNMINDTFPCMLSPLLHVLVLHSNMFHGEVRCHKRWPDLQIVDISLNNFSGSLELIGFSSWRAMVLVNDAQLRYKTPNFFLKVASYYIAGVRLIMKGLELELAKIWSDFTAVDLSCNNFKGEIPNAIGDLSLLHYLNLSYNVLNGNIPKSFGKMRKVESLDLSQNQLTGTIPEELAMLTFLAVLNLSDNKLVGKIPNGRQIQTFSADSFRGNAGLCGFNLNISCNSHSDDDGGLSPPTQDEDEEEIDWEYVSAALGYVVGLGSIVWLLLFCRSFRQKYFDKIDEVVEKVFDARNMRSRRCASARTRPVRNRVVRRQ